MTQKSKTNGNNLGFEPSQPATTDPVITPVENNTANDADSVLDESKSQSAEDVAKIEQDKNDAAALAELEKEEFYKKEAERIEAEKQNELSEKQKLEQEQLEKKSEDAAILEIQLSSLEEKLEYKVIATVSHFGFKKDKEYTVSGNVAKQLLRKKLVRLV